MNKKGKSTVKNQLTSLINKKSINEHFHEQKGLIDYKTIDQMHTLNISNLSRESTYKSHHQNRCDNTSNIYEHKNIKKKKIQEQYNRLLQMVNRYEKYYRKLLEHEKDNYIKYCRHIVDMIKNQFQKGKQQLQQKIKNMSTIFSSHRDKIFYEMKEIQHNDSHLDDIYESKLNQFKVLEYIDVQFMEILPINIEHLHQQFQKYQINFYQTNVKQKYNFQRKEHQLQSLRYISEVKNMSKEQCTQTQSFFEESKQVQQDDFDNFLGCDEQIGQQVSQSAKKRRKYEVKRQNIIKQQDEYEQNNSILSEN